MSESPRSGSLLVIFLTVFVDLLGFGMVIPLLPIYAEQFTLDESGLQLGLLMASFSAMQFLFAPMWGRLSDRIGRRPVLMIGLAGSVLFYALFGFATVLGSIRLLFVARIGAGIAGATISTAQAYIADTTSLQNRAKGMALIGAAFGLGFTFGPLFAYVALPRAARAIPGLGPVMPRRHCRPWRCCWPISNCLNRSGPTANRRRGGCSTVRRLWRPCARRQLVR